VPGVNEWPLTGEFGVGRIGLQPAISSRSPLERLRPGTPHHC